MFQFRRRILPPADRRGNPHSNAAWFPDPLLEKDTRAQRSFGLPCLRTCRAGYPQPQLRAVGREHGKSRRAGTRRDKPRAFIAQGCEAKAPASAPRRRLCGFVAVSYLFSSLGFFLSISRESFCPSAIWSAVIFLLRMPLFSLAPSFPLAAAMFNHA